MVSRNSYVTSVLTSVPANYSSVRKAARWARINVCLKGTCQYNKEESRPVPSLELALVGCRVLWEPISIQKNNRSKM